MTKRKHKAETESKAADKADKKELRAHAGAAAAAAQPADEVIRPYGQKIGAGPDNLRQREQWFQQRSGKRK